MLCEHGMPANHNPRVCMPLGLLGKAEPLSRWRYYAKYARALVELTAAIRQGNTGNRGLWETVLETSDVRSARRDERRTRNQLAQRGVDPEVWNGRQRLFAEKGLAVRVSYAMKSQEHAKLLLGVSINQWLELGNVRLELVLLHDPPVQLGADTFGAVGIQMMNLAAGTRAVAICEGCGSLHERRRMPKRGQKVFCEVCRENKVDERVRRRVQRARKGAADVEES